MSDSNEIYKIIPITSEQSKFEKTFISVNHDLSLELKNENRLNVYHLRTENRCFTYADVEEFCTGNLSQYVFNRQVLSKAKTMYEMQNLYKDACKKLRTINATNDPGAGGELGEILLYLFLEGDLRAPKLLSKMELKTSRNQYINGADGIHLHMTTDSSGLPVYQFVIGEAKIKNELTEAVREAMDSIDNALKEVNMERALVSNEIMKEVCTEEQAASIMRVLIPSEDPANMQARYEKGIGVFIGYTGDYDEDIENSVWNNTIDDKIKNDIKRAVKSMKNRIDKLKLKGYSFYCYFLPFNHAENDRKEIMKNIM